MMAGRNPDGHAREVARLRAQPFCFDFATMRLKDKEPVPVRAVEPMRLSAPDDPVRGLSSFDPASGSGLSVVGSPDMLTGRALELYVQGVSGPEAGPDLRQASGLVSPEQEAEPKAAPEPNAAPEPPLALHRGQGPLSFMSPICPKYCVSDT